MPGTATTAVAAAGSRTALVRRARRANRLLAEAYPEARCELDFGSPLELLVATILSAQSTDKRVNAVTPALFARDRTAADYAGADREDLEALIRPTGFFRAKAASLQKLGHELCERFGGEVPGRLSDLVTLPGVGRKTANVVLGHAYDVQEGIAVDTHVLRVSNRLGLAEGDDPLKIEQQLMSLVPRERWTRTTDLVIFHGRKVCDARHPRCGVCPVFALCAWESREAWASGDAKPTRSTHPPRRTARRPRA